MSLHALSAHPTVFASSLAEVIIHPVLVMPSRGYYPHMCIIDKFYKISSCKYANAPSRLETCALPLLSRLPL